MRRNLIDPEAAALWAEVDQATLRSWASRLDTGVHRYGGRYDVAELDAWLARRNPRMIRARPPADTPTK